VTTSDGPVLATSGVAASARPGSSPRGTIRGFLRRVLLSDYFILYLTLAYFIILSLFFPSLTEPRNISNQLSNVWPLLAVAIGQTFVLIVAGIDLSQGAIMGFVSVIGGAIMATAVDQALLGGSPLWGTVLNEGGGLLAGNSLAVPVAILAMLGVGALIGALNGIAITRFSMPPFMVTLVSLIFFSSAAIWLTQSQNISNLPAEFTTVGNGDIVSFYFGEKLEPEIRRRDILPFITYPAVIAGILAIVAHLVLSRTVFGRHIYAIGANRRAAEISGVPVNRVLVLVFAFSGLCAAIAAILYSARLQGGRPTIGGGNVLLDIIGATVIGGTSLAGGKGKVTWTLFGVIFFVLLLNTLNAMQLSAFHIDVVKGVIILLAAFLDVARTRLLRAERES
jgi:ribose/xylose/arabinose/galactoside ABC-type transport system permease subunit